MSFASSGPGVRTIVLDANILIRAVLGRRVLALLERYSARVQFVAPHSAFADAQTYVPEILSRRGLTQGIPVLLQTLERLTQLVTIVPRETYADLEVEARLRLRGRDEDDWPFVALALKLDCPIWTEDQDFFGSGVATWTTDRVEIYLSA